MKIIDVTILTTLLIVACPAFAMDDEAIERLATCQDSWLDWQTAKPAQLNILAGSLRSDFSQSPGNPYLVPKAPKSIAGLPLSQLYPNSVGMGVGFSVAVDATFDRTRQALEATLGKPLKKCETGDGMRSCELEIGEKRTFMLMSADNANSKTTLVGCYYYYEK
jgi:hypothetical protein